MEPAAARSHPDPRAAERARSLVASFGAGGDCSFGSQEEGSPGRAATLGRAPPEGEAWGPKTGLGEVVLLPDPRAAPVPGSERRTLSAARGATQRRGTRRRPESMFSE